MDKRLAFVQVLHQRFERADFKKFEKDFGSLRRRTGRSIIAAGNYA